MEFKVEGKEHEYCKLIHIKNLSDEIQKILIEKYELDPNRVHLLIVGYDERTPDEIKYIKLVSNMEPKFSYSPFDYQQPHIEEPDQRIANYSFSRDVRILEKGV